MRAGNSFYLAFSAKSSAFVLHRDFALRGWTSQYSKKYLLIKSPIEMKHIFSDTNQISHCAMNKFRYFHQFGRNVCFEAVVCNLQIISTKHWGTPQWTFLLSVMKENFYKQPLHRLCIGRCHSSEPHFALHSEAINTNICQERLFGIKKMKKKTGNLLTCPLPETTLKTRIIFLPHAHSRITAVLISATCHFHLWFVYCLNILREARFVHYKCAPVRFLKFWFRYNSQRLCTSTGCGFEKFSIGVERSKFTKVHSRKTLSCKFHSEACSQIF